MITRHGGGYGRKNTSMEININQMLCQGCEACVHACPNEAIYLKNGDIFIDHIKCNCCQACIRVCPTSALSVSESTPIEVIENPRALEVISPQTTTISAPKRSNTSGTVLSLVGQYVLPRMVDIFANYLERRLSPPVKDQSGSMINPITAPRCGRRMRRRGRFSGFYSERS